MSYWIAIGLSGLATYAMRVLPLAITLRGTAPTKVRRYLDALPTAVIAALAGAGIAVPDGTVTGGAEIVAAAVGIGLAAWRRNLLLSVIGAVLTVAALRAAGL
jgi:branched-subunit amino acid transport protein